MSINNNRGRHRANSTILTTIAQVSPVKARAFGGTAAAVVAGSGLMFGMAAPAQAGVVANDANPAPVAAAPAAVVEAPAVEAPAPAVETASTHTVVAGDTLGQIASTYGVSLDSVFALNGLSMASIIYPGDVITYAGAAAIQPAAAYTPVENYAAPVEAAPAAASYTDPGAYAELTTLSTPVAPAAPAAAVSGAGATMLSAAYSQLGAAQDCTVLVEVALRAAGHSVGDLAPAQLAAYGTPVSDPQPGDMVYYADGGMGFAHIAIYIGDGQAIHSGWNGNQTVIQSVNVGSGPVYYRA
ncbi:LysM peptidoglycan-binding domain-containing protein [Arthrobacter sp.]|uniref:C40 family peptidase n=1 Tax=Arthrobacter sp. TaxID=1667 RepID=UPI002897A320|nr:LysM peptidoglycan-binding domain-containing protein [Arthrobacter sp.]